MRWFQTIIFRLAGVRRDRRFRIRAPRSLYTLTRICSLKYIQERGICFRNHCGAEPPRDTEHPGLVATVGWRDRASTSYVAADRVKAPASAARGRFRGIHGGRTAPSLSTEIRTTSGGGCLAGSVPSVLVRSCGCSRTPPRPNGSINTNENEDKEKTTRPQTANVTKEKRNENQSD